MKNEFKNYLTLRKQIDTLTGKLETQHKKHMKCKAGCDLCCMDYSVFPIEFHSILENIKQYKIEPKTNVKVNEDDCIFLIDHKCTIYEERPIICRTHGLPLLFVSDKGNWELSACELNFTEFEMDKFSEENTFPQDKFNSKLFMLNKEFIKGFKGKEYGEFDLIPVKELKEYL